MPFCVVKSKTIKLAVLMIAIITILSISIEGSAGALAWFGYSTRKVPIYSVDTSQKKVALSFDAAWGADKTEEIIGILNEYNVSATFFLVGFWIDKYPEMVKKIDEASLEIGTHSNTHPDMVKLDENSMRKELQTCMEKITNITGKEVNVFRAPFGSYNNTLLNVASSLGLKTIQWDVDSLDWKGLSAGEITKRVISRVKNGSIILMHNNADHVCEAARLTIDYLKNKGYEITSVGNLIYKDSYTIDANGIQHQS